jgi:spermidine/putrescine transport system substrate-binding protein
MLAVPQGEIQMKKLLVLLLSTLCAGGCTKKSTTESAPKAAAGIDKRVVNLAIWGNYLSPEQSEAFFKKTGIEIRMSNYSSNEELLAKIQAGASGYDLAVPSDYMVEIMVKMEMLEPLDRIALTNFDELNPDFLAQSYDPANKFSVPYSWTSTGIAVQRDLFKGDIKGWKDLFTNKDLAGKISFLDDARETLGAALKKEGHSYNTTDTVQIEKAKKDLLAIRKNIKMFRSDLVEALANKEVAAAHAYSIDAFQARKKTNGKVDFIIPSEGSTMAIDNLVILKGAKHLKEAHELINFFLTPETNATFVKNMFAGPVLTKTKSLLPKDLQENQTLFPTKAALTKLERLQDLGETTRQYDEAWTEIKSN